MGEYIYWISIGMIHHLLFILLDKLKTLLRTICLLNFLLWWEHLNRFTYQVLLEVKLKVKLVGLIITKFHRMRVHTNSLNIIIHYLLKNLRLKQLHMLDLIIAKIISKIMTHILEIVKEFLPILPKRNKI